MVGSVQDVLKAAIATGSMGVKLPTNGSETATVDTEKAQKADAQEVAYVAKIKKDVREAVEDEKKSREPVGEEEANFITQELNELMSKINVDLEFQYHKEIDFMSVRMLDKSTQEVIREVPAEELIQHMIKVRNWIGAFLDKNA